MDRPVPNDEEFRRAIEREFIRILHNIHEHIEHLREAYSDGVRGEAKELLLKHIVHEETRNFEEATRLREQAAGYMDWEIKVLQDHSVFIRKVAEGEEIDPEVGLRLLHHFEEEHQEFFNRFGDPEYRGEGTQPAAETPPATEPAAEEETATPTDASLAETAEPINSEPEPEPPARPVFTVGKPEADAAGSSS